MERAQSRQAKSGPSPRVFLVDDHPIVRQAWRQMFVDKAGLTVVGEASGAPQALSGIADSNPDLVVVDLMLAEGGGIELIKDIRARWPDKYILVASMHKDPLHAERAMRAGANGYTTKDQPPKGMIDAVQAVLKGKIYLCPELSDALLHRVLQSGDGFTSPVESLSDRELQVFELLGDGLRTRDIAEKLSLSVKTIETYRDNIKQKLDLDHSSALIHRAVEWRLHGQDETSAKPEAKSDAG